MGFLIECAECIQVVIPSLDTAVLSLIPTPLMHVVL